RHRSDAPSFSLFLSWQRRVPAPDQRSWWSPPPEPALPRAPTVDPPAAPDYTAGTSNRFEVAAPPTRTYPMSQHRPALAGAEDPAPLPQQVQDLLVALDPDERLALLHQATPAVDRLALAPSPPGPEVLHGVPCLAPPTVARQPVSLAATW